MSRSNKLLFILMAFFAIVIGLYPSIYLIFDQTGGFLNSKSAELLASDIWNTAFYTHIIFGGVALLAGWSQFSKKLRNKNISVHRLLGKLYLLCVLLSGFAGIYMGYYANGGWISASGFMGLGIVWVSTAIMAYLAVRKGDIDNHKKMMIYSYAACFAAVTLRIWLPILGSIFDEFITGYRIVAWLCWVPNMGIAWLITRNASAKKLSFA